eukprot:5440692-Amphidinium_carterae.1
MLPLVEELAAIGVLVLDYADDLTIVTESLPELQEALALVQRYLQDGGIQLNMGKCQYFATNGSKQPFNADGILLEPRAWIKVLGHEIRVDFNDGVE